MPVLKTRSFRIYRLSDVPADDDLPSAGVLRTTLIIHNTRYTQKPYVVFTMILRNSSLVVVQQSFEKRRDVA